MPLPTSRDVHVNAPLTNVSVAYVQKNDNYLATKVFPMVSVAKQSDLYYVYDKGDWLRTEARKRAPGTESVGAGYRLSRDSYFCDVWSVHHDVSDQTRSNQDTAIDMDRDATEFVTQQLMMKKDQEWAENYFNNDIWGVDAVANWVNPTSTTAVPDIRNLMTNMHRSSGFRPNTLVFGRAAWDRFIDTTSALERIQFSAVGVVGVDLVKAVFGVDNVHIANSVRNNAPEGAALDVNFSDANLLADGHSGVWVGYVNPTPSLMQPSAGYTFTWSGLTGASDYGLRIKRFRMEHFESDRIEGECSFDMKVVNRDMGAFLDVQIA